MREISTGTPRNFAVSDAKIFQVGDIRVGYRLQQFSGGRALEREGCGLLGNILDLYVQAERVLLEPAEAGVGGGPAIFIFAKAGDGAVVDYFAVGVAPAAVNDLIDTDFVDVAGDDAVYELGGVAAGYAIFEKWGNIDERGGVADGVVLVLVVHLVDAHGVIAGPLAIVEAFAERHRSLVKGSAYRHAVSQLR